MKKSTPKQQHLRIGSQDGLTLLELMVALALGAFLVIGVVNVFLTTRESSNVEAALARVQESGRFALDMLSADLRRAHYTGCNSINRDPTIMMNDFSFVGVRGYSRDGDSWKPSLATASDPSLLTISNNAISSGVRGGTDLLNLHLSSYVGNDLLDSDIGTSDTEFGITGNPDCMLEDGDALIISNCLTSHAFWADLGASYDCTDDTAALTVKLDATKNLSSENFGAGYIYTSRTQLLKLESVSWFVGDTGRQRNGETVWALYRQSLDRQPVEMIEGVEFMQIQYGQRGGTATAPTTRFVSADDPAIDWDQVVSVRIGLLVQNYDNVRDANDPRTYVLADPNSPIDPAVHGGGLVLRQAFRLTTALRNTGYDI